MASTSADHLYRPDGGESSARYYTPTSYSWQNKVLESANDRFGPIQIVLNYPADYTYTAGEAVTGCLITRGHVSIVESINVRLEGRSKTKIVRSNGQSSTTYRGRVLLLNQNWTLPRPEERDDLTIWPFSIQFPFSQQGSRELSAASGIGKDRTFSDYWDFSWDILPPYDTNLNQPLPPNFSGTYNRSRESYVAYSLNASVRIRGSEKPHESIQPLNFHPLSQRNPQIALPLAKFTGRETARSLLLLPENEGRSLTFKENVGSLFKHSSLPSFTFGVEMTLPYETSLGEPLTTVIRVVPDMSTSTAPQIPEIKLSLSRLAIRSYTHTRCTTTFGHNIKENHSLVVYSRGRFTPATLSKANDYTIESRTGPISGFVPSFATFNIQCSYRIKVTWVLEIKNKTFKISRDANLYVHSGRYPPGTQPPPQAQYQSLGLGGDMAGPSDGTLPQYSPPQGGLEPPTYDQVVSGEDEKF